LKQLLLATMLMLAVTEARPGAPSIGAPAGPARIEIAGYAFDPLSEEPPIPAELRAAPASGTGWWLVQLHRSPTRTERADLKKKFALELARHFPAHTYLEKTDATRIDDLRKQDIVRAVVPHQPAFKISPALRSSTERRVIVTLFDRADSERVVASLQGLGAAEIDIRRSRIHCTLAEGANVVQIARLSAVRWIEAQPSRKEDAPANR